MMYLPVPSVVSFIQILFTSVVVLSFPLFGIKVDALEWTKFKAYSFYIATFVAVIFSNMQALNYSNVETVIVFRA